MYIFSLLFYSIQNEKRNAKKQTNLFLKSFPEIRFKCLWNRRRKHIKRYFSVGNTTVLFVKMISGFPNKDLWRQIRAVVEQGYTSALSSFQLVCLLCRLHLIIICKQVWHTLLQIIPAFYKARSGSPEGQEELDKQFTAFEKELKDGNKKFIGGELSLIFKQMMQTQNYDLFFFFLLLQRRSFFFFSSLTNVNEA